MSHPLPAEVIERMKYLRYVEHMTLEQIGQMQNPPISRQRVQKLIGRTGQVALINRREVAIRESEKQ